MRRNDNHSFGARRRKRKAVWVTGLVLLTASMASASGCGGDEPGSGDTLTIGNIQTTTGPAAAYGISNTRGAEIAIDEINSDGGIEVGDSRYQLALNTQDDQGKPDQGVVALRELLSKNVHFVLGPSLSTVASAMAPTWDREAGKSLFIVTGGSAPDLAPDRPNVFMTAILHTDLADAAVWFFGQHEQGYERAGVIADSTFSTLGVTFKDRFEDAWTAAGGTISSSAFTKGAEQTDFLPQLASLERASPDFVVSAQPVQPNAASIKQAQQVGLDVPFVSTAGGSPDEAEIAGSAIDGNYELAGVDISTLQAQDKDYVKQLQDAYSAKYDESLDDLVGTFTNAYTSVYALADALQRAGTVDDVDAVTTALSETSISDLPDLVGDKYVPIGADGLLFRPTHEAELRVAILRWVNEELKLAAIAKGSE